MADYTASTYTRAALPAWAEDPSKFNAATLSSMAGPVSGATSYTPDDNALVAKNLQKLLSQNDPWMVSARARASQYANRRGLLNSSIAVGEGEKAAIETAIPVATTDAQSWLTAQRDNAAAANTFARDANSFSREGALSALRAGYDMASADRGYAFQSGESAAERGLRSDLAARSEALQRDDLSLKRDMFGTDTRLRESDLGLRRDSLQAETTLRERELSRLEAAGATDEELRRADLAMRERSQEADARLRESDLALRREGLGTDTRLRESELALRGETLDQETALRERELARLEANGATDAELRRADLAMRERSLTSEIGLKQEDLGLRRDELGLREDELALRGSTEERAAAGREAELLQQMQRTYLDARTTLETSQNLDSTAKAAAIDGLNQWFEKTALPTLRASLGNPAAWPDFGSIAPAPTAPQPPVAQTGPFQPPTAGQPYRAPGDLSGDEPIPDDFYTRRGGYGS